MRQLYTLLVLGIVVASPARAQVNTDGYYRVQNVATQRWAALYDNRGKLDKSSTSADVAAIRSYYYFDRIVSDPASVIYFEKSSSGYTLKAQGADTKTMMSGYYLQLKAVGTTGKIYQAYGTESGYQIYLSDEKYYSLRSSTVSKYNEKYDSLGYFSTAGADTRNFYILPISSSGTNYFGFKPTLKVGDSYYQSFYAQFPFKFAGTGMTAYYVDQRDDYHAIARLTPITTTEIPGATPMIISCSSPDATNNRVDLLTSTTSKVTGNLLTGVYFCSTNNLLPTYDQFTGSHENYVLNDPSTMRLLAVENGELVLKKSTATYIPANTFYMKVTAGSPDVYRLLLKDAFATGIDDITVEASQSDTIYNLSGQKVSDRGTDGLPAGIYVRDGKKIVVR